MTAVAAVALVGAVLLWWPAAPRRRLDRLTARARSRGRRVPARVFGWPAAVAGPTVGGFLVASGRGASIGFCLGMLGVVGATVWLDHRARAVSRRRSEQVVAGCVALAGLLRVGYVPVAALRIAAGESPALAQAAAVQQIGGQVPSALRRLGAAPGCSGLTELALAWEVSARTGASLTTTLDALSDRLEAARKLHRVVDAELAAPRATSRMLAVLPFAGLALGFAFGGDPLAFLLGTGLGQLALCLGVTLACAGVWWTEHIARAAGG